MAMSMTPDWLKEIEARLKASTKPEIKIQPNSDPFSAENMAMQFDHLYASMKTPNFPIEDVWRLLSALQLAMEGLEFYKTFDFYYLQRDLQVYDRVDCNLKASEILEKIQRGEG
jgi:hypothetical protein